MMSIFHELASRMSNPQMVRKDATVIRLTA